MTDMANLPASGLPTQWLVLGETKSGKTTFAAALERILGAHGPVGVYEAGSWVRRGFAHTPQAQQYTDEFDPAFKNALTEFALTALRANPLVSFEAYEAWAQATKPEVAVIVGIRNPDDFIRVTQRAQRSVVLRLEPARKHTGALGQLEKGLEVIDAYLAWKESLGFPQLSLVPVSRDLIFASDEQISTHLRPHFAPAPSSAQTL